MENRFRITQPDGDGSSMHETIAIYDTESEVIDFLENYAEIDDLMVEDRLSKETSTAYDFINA